MIFVRNSSAGPARNLRRELAHCECAIAG
jgi:hypothetical protein